jgi:hypothetical protein
MVGSAENHFALMYSSLSVRIRLFPTAKNALTRSPSRTAVGLALGVAVAFAGKGFSPSLGFYFMRFHVFHPVLSFLGLL